MADHDEQVDPVDPVDSVEETVMLTRRGRRSQRAIVDAAAGHSGDQDAPAHDATAQDVAAQDAGVDLDDRTIAVPRVQHAAEDDVDDRTIAVSRVRDAGAEEDDDVDDRTIAVSRSRDVDAHADLDDRTIAVSRSEVAATRSAGSDETQDEHTVVVDRAVRSSAPAVSGSIAAEADDLDATIPAPPARRAETTVLPAIYKPRPTPRQPSRPPAVAGAIAPTRVIDEDAASVSRTARRDSVRVLAAVACACAVSVGGLVALGFFVFA